MLLTSIFALHSDYSDVMDALRVPLYILSTESVLFDSAFFINMCNNERVLAD